MSHESIWPNIAIMATERRRDFIPFGPIPFLPHEMHCAWRPSRFAETLLTRALSSAAVGGDSQQRPAWFALMQTMVCTYAKACMV
jgi:hypothetical protein